MPAIVTIALLNSSYRHSGNGAVIARSSQPLVGVLGWRNSDDERLLQAISQSCARTSQGHTPFQGASNPVPILYRNSGPPVQRMEDRGQVTQSVVIANGKEVCERERSLRVLFTITLLSYRSLHWETGQVCFCISAISLPGHLSVRVSDAGHRPVTS